MINVNDTNDFVGFLDSQYSDQAITPHMDSLAAIGVNFTNAHCATPSCTPSRHALFYGLYPFNTGLYRYNFNIYDAMGTIKKKYPKFASMNETLKKRGYQRFGLGHVHGNNDKLIAEHLGIEWDYFHKQKHLKRTPDPRHSQTLVGRKQVFGATTNGEEEYDSYRYATKAIEILGDKHEKPFFLAVGFQEAHTPLLPPLKYYSMFRDLKVLPIIEDDLDDVAAVGKKLAKNGTDHDEVKRGDHWRELIRSYLAVLTFVDAQVGRVMTALDESDYRDNTIVILWSDHGNNYGRKLKRGKFTLWEASTRVPFVIWDPRNRSQTGVCSQPVSLVDIYPTVLEMIGAPPIEHLDGESLTPWMQQPNLPRETPAITMMGRGNYAIRDKQWRYIRYFDGGEELYHTRVDRDEIKNLVNNPKHAETLQRLRAFIPKHEEPMNTSELGKMEFYDADFPLKKSHSRDSGGSM